MAEKAGAGDVALPDAAVEPAPVSHTRKVLTVAVLAALVWAGAPIAETQKPIRIGASLAQTGVDATIGQARLPGTSSASST